MKILVIEDEPGMKGLIRQFLEDEKYVADMASAIQQNSINRCNGNMAFQVLEVMHAFLELSESGRHILIESSCERPKMLPLNLKPGQLIVENE